MAQTPNPPTAVKPAAPPIVSPSGSAAVHPKGIPPFSISPIKRPDRYIKELIYGKHGMGKTTLGASAADVPAMADVFMIDVESGDLTIQDNERIVNQGNILSAKANDILTVGKMFEFLSAHAKLRDVGTPEADNKLRETQDWLTFPDKLDKLFKFRTVLFDSLSEAEQYNMGSLMGYDAEKLLVGESDDVDVAGWTEFRKNKTMIELLVRKFRSLPMNFICICAESYVEDEIKRKSYAPALTGKLSSTIQGPFDLVGHLIMGDKDQQGNQPRLLRTKPDGRSAAKCRFSTFKGDGFADPTQLKIMTAVGLLAPTK